MTKEDLPTRKLNRLSSKEPKAGLFWCSNCDRNKVAANKKCEVCGKREYGNNSKKQYAT